MREVAERAGVSAATVSRVLSGSACVRPDKRDQVLHAVEEIGYRPNRVATNMRRQRAQMVGVVVPSVEDPYFSQMVRAVEDACYAKGFGVLLCDTGSDPAKQREHLSGLAAERVAGAIISPIEAGAPEIGELLDSGAAVVAFGRRAADPRAGAVTTTDFEAGHSASEHLLARGHTRIGFIGGPRPAVAAAEHQTGYERAVGAAGAAPIVARSSSLGDDGGRAAKHLIEGGATALVVAGNPMAASVVHYLKIERLRMPGDVALVTIGQPPWAELTNPPLTSLAPPVRAMASAAVDLMVQRLERERKRGTRLVFEFEWRHRGSCCPGGLPE
jgi:LacI family transcriptional regulator